MGQPVVHFEVIGKDGDALRSFYSNLFGWEIDASNPMNVEAALAKAESLGAKRVMGPEKIMDGSLELGQFTDPEGHLIGLVNPSSER
jgi:predicted enzyme related to lactoylglutathione lyase